MNLAREMMLNGEVQTEGMTGPESTRIAKPEM